MFEILVAVGLIGVLVALGWAGAALPWATLVVGGGSLSLLGLVLGLPPALVYHVKLRRMLLEVGRLPSRWWLNPTKLHDNLTDEQMASFLPWFAVGGFGFVMVAAGCVATVIGLIRSI